MDFLDFIQSETVRDYVRESGYKLTSKDATCIVYNSERSLEDKLNAYQAIIDTMPDCKIDKYYDIDDQFDCMLHSELKKIIEHKRTLISLFNKKDTEYTISIRLDDLKLTAGFRLLYILTDDNNNESDKQFVSDKFGSFDNYWHLKNCSFPSIQACIDSINNLPENTSGRMDNNGFFINKSIESNKITIHANYIFDFMDIYNNEYNLMDIDADYLDSELQYESLTLYDKIKQIELNENFPFPFKTGDMIFFNSTRSSDYQLNVVHIRYEGDKQTRGYYNINDTDNLNKSINYFDLTSSKLLLSEMPTIVNGGEYFYFMSFAISAYLNHKIGLDILLKIYSHYIGQSNGTHFSNEEIDRLKELKIIIERGTL